MFAPTFPVAALPAAAAPPPPLRRGSRPCDEFDYFVVIDFEATCERGRRIYPQEIIEFPAVLVDAATGRLVSAFRAYVRPRHHPRLSDFCRELTGISQEDVDGGVELAEALRRHDEWLQETGVKGGGRFAVVTWSDADCRNMLDQECRFKGIAKPAYFDRWVDLRVPFEAAFGVGVGAGRRVKLPEAVRAAGLQWTGRQHCGLDDACNTARLLVELMRRGVPISITSSLPPAPEPAQKQKQQQQQQEPQHRHPQQLVPCGAAAVCCYCGVASVGGLMAMPGSTQRRCFYGCGNWTPASGPTCSFFLVGGVVDCQ
ncbi:ERI1 exoribonuclease 2-like [Oryza brachyantha]|nr:ERI1 exoribonuclease 2-like [Oryza brachyantha]